MQLSLQSPTTESDKYALNRRKLGLVAEAEALCMMKGGATSATSATSATGGQTGGAPPPSAEAALALQARLPALRNVLKLSPVDRGTSQVSMVLRFALTLVATMLVGVWLLLLSPLRMLHPLLRRLGLANGWLPFDVCTVVASRLILGSAGVSVSYQVESEGGGGGEKGQGKGGAKTKAKAKAKVMMFSHGDTRACRKLSPAVNT